MSQSRTVSTKRQIDRFLQRKKASLGIQWQSFFLTNLVQTSNSRFQVLLYLESSGELFICRKLRELLDQT